MNAAGSSAILSIPSFRVAHNLALVFAFAILKDVLNQLRYEGQFKSKRNELGFLMSNSKSSIKWVDYKTVDCGREIRNKIVHNNEVFDAEICFKHINVVERELKTWKVI